MKQHKQKVHTEIDVFFLLWKFVDTRRLENRVSEMNCFQNSVFPAKTNFSGNILHATHCWGAQWLQYWRFNRSRTLSQTQVQLVRSTSNPMPMTGINKTD